MYYQNRILKGQIYYVSKTEKNVVGSEQKAGRPAIIVSNNIGNRYSKVVEVVYLTTQIKANIPTHVPIMSARKPSIALCEEIVSVDKQRLEKYLGSITPEEMQQVNQAMMISLGIIPENLMNMVSNTVDNYAENTKKEKQIELDTSKENLIRMQTERDVYKNLYGDLLRSLYKGKKLYA